MKTKQQYCRAVSKWLASLCFIVLLHSVALASGSDFLSESQALVRQAEDRMKSGSDIDKNNLLARLQNLLPADTKTKAMSTAMLFVSFSMPDNSLRAWITQATQLQIPILIRGLYQDSLLKTQQKVATLLPDEQGGVAIDPTLFKKFSIEQVPTLVLIKAETQFDKVAGNVGLSTLLEVLTEDGEFSQDIAKQLLARLKP